jgi:hypothetical protein
VGRPSKWKGRLFALLGGFALLGAAEGLLRLFGYRYTVETVAFRFVGVEVLAMPELQRDRALFWRLRPGAPDLHPAGASGAVTNAAGFRGPLVATTRTPGVARVAGLGDSITYGVGLPLDDSYLGQMQKTVEYRLGRRVEMVYAGCPGYSTYQGLRLLESDVLPLAPDVVTLMFGSWNDYTPAVGGDDEAKGRHQRRPPWLDPVLAAVGDSRLFMAVSQAHDAVAGGRRDARFGLRSNDEYLRGFAVGRPPEGERVPPDRFRSNLEGMVRLLRARKIVPVLITPPLSAKSRREYPVYQLYFDLVHQVARAEGVTLVPAAEHLWAWEERGEPVFADWVHPTRRGNTVIEGLLTPVVMEALGGPAPATAGTAGDP